MLIWLRKLAVRLSKDEGGATAIEYGLIAALISVVIIVALLAVGGALTEVFTTIGDCLSGATEAGGVPAC